MTLRLLVLSLAITLISFPHARSVAQEPTGNFDQASALEAVLGVFEQRYVFPDVADRMTAHVRGRFANGDYAETASLDEFAERLTQDLRSVSDDGHIMVYRIQTGPYFKADDEFLTESEIAEHARKNFGFREVKWLTGNVGYIRLDHFDYAEIAGPTATAAVSFVANADAVIIDMRENSGGREEMVQFLFSYFFEHPSLLLTFYDRDNEVIHQTRSLAYVPGPRLPEIPLYILTSERTASAGEAFTYSLQAHGRATVVGEATRGIAHWIDTVDLPDQALRVHVPYARPESEKTGTNWEGIGVKPDIEITAAKALAAAHLDAMQNMIDRCLNAEACNDLEWDMAAVKGMADPIVWNSETMAAYTGVYDSGRYSIFIEDGQLFWKYRPEINYVLLPITEDLFAFDDTDDLRFRISRDDNGDVSGFQLVYKNGETGNVKTRSGDLP